MPQAWARWRLTAMLLMLVWTVLGSFMVQSTTLAVHQGVHAAQALHVDAAGKPALDEGPCAVCSVLRMPSQAHSFAIALDDVAPLVTRIVACRPVDPKQTIRRTCDARGPPSLA